MSDTKYKVEEVVEEIGGVVLHEVVPSPNFNKTSDDTGVLTYCLLRVE